MSDPSSLRVADADREQVVSELREHAVAGRLTPDELEERIGKAYRASAGWRGGTAIATPGCLGECPLLTVEQYPRANIAR